MTTDSDDDLWRSGVMAGDAHRVDGSRVWISADARKWFREQYGWTDRQAADYLRMQHQVHQAALSPSNIGTDELAPWLGAPSGPQQEYETTVEES